MSFKFKRRVVVVACILLASASVNAQSISQSRTLQEIRGDMDAVTQQQQATSNVSEVRAAALREAAQHLGGIAGRRDRIIEIRESLNRKQDELDRAYNFGRMILGPGFLPPVILKAEDVLALGENSFRVGKAIYQIEKGARPAPTNPTWRNWLYIGLESMEVPSAQFARAGIPRNSDEKKFFDSVMAEAYQHAYEVAGETFLTNMAEMRKEYSGMTLFFQLYAQGKVTAPQIKSAHRVVTRDGERVMTVGDSYFVVASDTRFVDDSTKWKPLGH